MSLAPRTLALAAVFLLVAGGAIGWALAGQAEAPEAKRQALAASDDPRGAKDRTLGLSRVVVPAGAELALHHHQGTQVAYIDSGTLTYTVETGSVEVRKGPADGGSEVVREIAGGETGKIKAGQWIVEQPSDHHSAANRTSKRIVIYLATLLEDGAPPSTPG
jgi:hypothetical protein